MTTVQTAPPDTRCYVTQVSIRKHRIAGPIDRFCRYSVNVDLSTDRQIAMGRFRNLEDAANYAESLSAQAGPDVKVRVYA